MRSNSPKLNKQMSGANMTIMPAKAAFASVTPSRKASAVNDDLFTGGAFNLTEVKVIPSANLSPDNSLQRI